ncbi:MAG: phospholipid carrier-dependent glycosyltransferase [Actinobacteria bacterium]|nr:phospholipid carrier-dependent glycosyltransferase [Actinomycetota bacterium]
MTSERLRWRRADTVAVTLITATAAVVRAIHLTRPKTIVFDEFFYAREACFLVHRSQQVCGIGEGAISPHPPLGKWLITLGIRAFGYNPLGWRVSALIAGILTVSLLYMLARMLLGSTLGAAMAAGLLAIDPLHFVHSRVAMLDVFVTLFIVLSFLLLVIDRDRVEGGASAARGWLGVRSRGWLLAAGAAAATKWVGFLALAAVAGLAALWAVQRVTERRWPARILSGLRAEGPILLVAMVVAPLLIYVASFLGRVDGSVLSWPWTRGSWVRNFLGVQKEMLRFHLVIEDVSPYTSPPWSWLLIKRPLVYLREASGGSHREILAIGIPVVWWASLPALVYLGIRATSRRHLSAVTAVVIGGFAILYVPWLAVTTERSFTFLFYLLPAVPFMCLALAAVATPLARSLIGRAALALLCALAIAFFSFFYPVLTATPISKPALEARQWFDDCRVSPGSLAPNGWCWR